MYWYIMYDGIATDNVCYKYTMYDSTVIHNVCQNCIYSASVIIYISILKKKYVYNERYRFIQKYYSHDRMTKIPWTR